MEQSVKNVQGLYAKHGVNPDKDFWAVAEKIDSAIKADGRNLGGDLRLKLWEEFGADYWSAPFPRTFFYKEIETGIEIGTADSPYPIHNIDEYKTETVDVLIGESGILSLPAEFLYIWRSLRERGVSPLVFFAGGINNKKQFTETLCGLTEPAFYAQVLKDYIPNLQYEGGAATDGKATLPCTFDFLRNLGFGGKKAKIAYVLANDSYIARKAEYLQAELAKPENADLAGLEIIFLTCDLYLTDRELPDASYNLLKAHYVIAGFAAWAKDAPKKEINWAAVERMMFFGLSMGWPDFLVKAYGLDKDTATLLVALADFQLRWVEEQYGYDIQDDIKTFVL